MVITTLIANKIREESAKPANKLQISFDLESLEGFAETITSLKNKPIAPEN